MFFLPRDDSQNLVLLTPVQDAQDVRLVVEQEDQAEAPAVKKDKSTAGKDARVAATGR